MRHSSIFFLVWSLLGAITLRAAYSICVSRNLAPGFAKAWWISIIVSLASLPVTILNLAISVSIPELALPVGTLALMAAACIFGAVYQTTLRVTFGQGLLLWLLQFIVHVCLFLAVTAAIFQVV